MSSASHPLVEPSLERPQAAPYAGHRYACGGLYRTAPSTSRSVACRACGPKRQQDCGVDAGSAGAVGAGNILVGNVMYGASFPLAVGPAIGSTQVLRFRK